MKVRLLAALTAAIVAAPAVAHHSFAMFDMNKVVTLKGAVEVFKWSNPHAWLSLAVPNADGTAEHWAIELTSPNNLVHQGWKRTTLKPGDKVTVMVHPLNSGKAGGSLYKVKLADGTELGSATSQDSSNNAK